MHKPSAPWVGLLAIWLLATGSALADSSNGPTWELGIQGGFFLPDRDLTGKPATFSQVEALGGLRGGALFGKRWSWFADVAFFDINTNIGAEDADVLSARSGVELFLAPHAEPHPWFLAFGGGWSQFDLEFSEGFDRSFASLSVGQRIALDERAHLRWELRGDHTIGDEGLGGATLDRLQAILGLTWNLGRAGDADGDGIRDGRDRCPATPRGAVVDADGCPTDSDGDGVFDGIDECSDTPRGARVDPTGCPLDSDGDGIFDGIDECPTTPRGAVVDLRGCPLDSDGDGVFDGIDECPTTPRGARVDSTGCPLDSDGDGVFDGIDECPTTPRGAVVDLRGCPLDSDGDGVFDGIDECPGTPAGTTVDTRGCPVAPPLFEPDRPTLILEGVKFELNSAVLRGKSREILERVARSLLAAPQVRVEIGGHTDSTGTDDYNQGLSKRRAAAVRDHLVSRDVPAARLVARGYGETRPIADNRTREGRALNRRVELTRLDPEPAR